MVGHAAGDLLWAKRCERVREGSVIQAWSTNNEQRYSIRMYGDTNRHLVAFDGLYLVQTNPPRKRDK